MLQIIYNIVTVLILIFIASTALDDAKNINMANLPAGVAAKTPVEFRIFLYLLTFFLCSIIAVGILLHTIRLQGHK